MSSAKYQPFSSGINVLIADCLLWGHSNVTIFIWESVVAFLYLQRILIKLAGTSLLTWINFNPNIDK